MQARLFDVLCHMTLNYIITKWIKDWYEVREAPDMHNSAHYRSREVDRRLSTYLVM